MEQDWDQHYQDQHTPWDKGTPSPPLLNWLAAHPGTMAGRVMVPGCGLGHDVRAIASHEPKAEIVGLDISQTAIRQASEIEPVHEERYRQGDLFDLPEGMLEAFDWVFEHTCYCAIDPGMRNDYVKAVWTALRPEGQLLAIFYLNPYDDEHSPGGGPPHGCSFEELQRRFEETGRFEFLDSYVPDQTYEGREKREIVIHMRKLN